MSTTGGLQLFCSGSISLWCASHTGILTLKLRFDLPGVGGEAPKDMPLGVSDKQQGGPLLHQAGHHPGKALPVQPSGKHKPPGGAVAIWQLVRLTVTCGRICVTSDE